MRYKLVDAVETADWHDDIRAVIFTGAGRAFWSGKDLRAGGATSIRARMRAHVPPSHTPAQR